MVIGQTDYADAVDKIKFTSFEMVMPNSSISLSIFFDPMISA